MVKLTCPSGVDGNDEVIECKRLIGDVAYWPQAAVGGCVLFRCCQGRSRHPANRPKMTRMTHSRPAPEHSPSGRLNLAVAAGWKAVNARVHFVILICAKASHRNCSPAPTSWSN